MYCIANRVAHIYFKAAVIAMDAGLAEYLSRMEAAVLAARGGMAKLSAENSQLRERVAGEE